MVVKEFINYIDPDELVERLAKHCHDQQWSGWMAYMLPQIKPFIHMTDMNRCPEGFEAIARWNRQMTTEYENLAEWEKESDRREARAILATIFPQDAKRMGWVSE